MAKVSLTRAVAGMKASSDRAGGGVLWRTREEAGDGDEEAAEWDEERVVLSDDFTAVKLHQLAITLRPLTTGGSGGRPMLTASRWEVRKAIMSLCRSQPTMFEIEATDKSASIRVAFSAAADADALSRSLRGVTVKIKGVKLHAFVREVSESAVLSEGEDWAASTWGSRVLSADTVTGREAVFDSLEPGKRPDTIVLRGIPANWLGGRGKAAEGTEAPGLEEIMSKFGPVRAVEVQPSAPIDSSIDSSDAAAAFAGGGGGGGQRSSKKSGRPSADFDVNALLENMPKPRALAKDKGGGSKGSGSRPGGRSGGSGSAGLVLGGDILSVGLHVDAWVQFASFLGFQGALEAMRAKTLQKAGAELVCEYRLGVDTSGFMTEDRRRERVIDRAEKAREEERRKASIEKARGQLALLWEGLRGLRDAVAEDGRPALEDATKPTLQKVTGHVEGAEALLGVREVLVDEPAATAAVAHARGEVAIARLSVRKAKAAVDRAEEEERIRIEREKDRGLRDAARATLVQLRESLSQGLALVAAERQHRGIKPQADRAAALLDEVSEACSKEGGSEAFGGTAEGGLVADARRATETAITRACMLQRYLSTCARLKTLKATIATTVDHPPADGGSGDNNKGSLLAAQVEVAETVLSRDLEGLSEGDLLLMWESAEEALGVADGLLESLKLVKAARHRLADTRAAVASGDPSLRSSEGIMRLIAAAVMSTARAQREGAVKHLAAAATAGGNSVTSPAETADRWRRAAISADSDVAAAMREVERVTGELRDKHRREEEEQAWRKAQEERRVREEEAQRLERQARAAEREMIERRQAEARISAMELRRNEMVEQVRNKAARKRLQEQFRAQQAARDAAGRKKDSGGSKKHAESPSMADRWTLEEGLVQVADGGNHNSGTLAPTPGVAAAAPGAAGAPSTVAGPKSPGGNNKGERRDSAKVSQAEALATASTAVAATAVVPRDPGDDRWGMNDGAADLAERGVELEGGGAGLYLPPPPDWPPGASLLPGGAKGGRRGRKRNRQASAEKEEVEQWLEMVSKRVRSKVVGAAPTGSWGAANDEDGSGSAVPMDVVVDGGSLDAVGAVRVGGSEGGANRAPNGAGSATGAGNVGGGDVEAELRQRLLAAMMGRSKSKSRSRLSGNENPAVTAASAEKPRG
ncbi:unnamed protein product [Ectocarpus sp. 12 AP-2014]